MNKWQAMVHEFMEGAHQTIGDSPELRDTELRAKLIMEEAVETVAAMGYHVTAEISRPQSQWEVGEHLTYIGEVAHFVKDFDKPDFEEAIDGLADLIYVVVGAAVAWGIDLDPFFAEVQRANMEKLQGPKRADGKQLKPEGWRPPDIERILIRQIESAREWNERANEFLMNNGTASP